VRDPAECIASIKMLDLNTIITCIIKTTLIQNDIKEKYLQVAGFESPKLEIPHCLNDHSCKARSQTSNAWPSLIFMTQK